MDQITELPSTEGIISCRIRFVRELPDEANATVIHTFSEPHSYFVIKENIPVAQLLRNENNKATSAEELLFLALPNTFSTTDLRKETEAWLNGIHSISEAPVIELVAKPNRVLWHPLRVVVIGEQKISEETFMALVEFAFFEGVLRTLELRLKDYFAICSQDIPLTHGVGVSDLRRQTHVNKMTQQITSSRMEFVRLIPCFANLYGRLAPHTKHLIGELTKKTRVWDDRIEAVDDKLEFLEDVYELANDRLTEFRYFRRESTLELWIIALLVLELAVTLWEARMLIFYNS